MKDESQKSSPTNPEFIERMQTALAFQKAEEEISHGNGPNFPGWETTNKNNEARTLEENTYRGPNTVLVQRIAASSELPAMGWDERGKFYRDQVEARVKADEAKEKALVKGWKSKEQEYDDMIQKLSENTY